MSFFTDLLTVVKENPVAAAACAVTGAVVVGATWAATAAFGGEKKQDTKPAPAQPAAAQAAEAAAKTTAETAAQAATQAAADATKA